MRINYFLVSLVYTLLLTGCVTNQEKEITIYGGLEKVGVIERERSIESDPLYSLGQGRVGIRWLDENNKEKTNLQIAEKKILAGAGWDLAEDIMRNVLFDYPHEKTPKLLMNQIEADPKIFFKSINVSLEREKLRIHRVKKRENIKKISKKYYKNSNYYIALLRFNKMAGEVKEGDLIHIPGGKDVKKPRRIRRTAVIKPKADTVVVDQKQPEPSNVSSNSEQDNVNSGSNVDQDKVPTNDSEVSGNNSDVVSDNRSDVIPIKEAAGENSADIIKVDENELIENSTLVEDESEPEVDGNTGQSVEQVLESEDQITDAESTRNQKEKEAFDLYERGDEEEALAILQSMDSLSIKGQNTLSLLTGNLVSDYYEKGLKYYQQQKLELAITQFNKVLDFSPMHAQALIYKDRCEQLLEKLQKL